MSSASQNAEKIVESPVESLNECEVSSSSKTNDSKPIQNSIVDKKENTEITNTNPQTAKPPADNSKMTESKQRTENNKVNSEQNTRNPLAENATTTVSNNDSNRSVSVKTENKTPPKSLSTNPQHEATNNINNNNNNDDNNDNSNNNNNNSAKLRARAGQNKQSHTSPQSMPTCGWCMDRKPILTYILPTSSGENLLFCTENCIAEFRKAVKRGACKQCGHAVLPTVTPHTEYCSTICMNKAMPKNGNC